MSGRLIGLLFACCAALAASVLAEMPGDDPGVSTSDFLSLRHVCAATRRWQNRPIKWLPGSPEQRPAGATLRQAVFPTLPSTTKA